MTIHLDQDSVLKKLWGNKKDAAYDKIDICSRLSKELFITMAKLVFKECKDKIKEYEILSDVV